MTTITTQLADALRAVSGAPGNPCNCLDGDIHGDCDHCKAREALAAYDAQQAQSKSCEYVLEGCERFIAAFHRGDFGAHGYKIVQDAAALLERIRASRICGHSACSQHYIDTGSRECVQAGDHTAEPWRVDAGAFAIIKPRALPEYCDETIMTIPQGLTDEDDTAHLANARRIVACVNACAGIPTDKLEQLTPANVSDALRPFLYGY